MKGIMGARERERETTKSGVRKAGMGDGRQEQTLLGRSGLEGGRHPETGMPCMTNSPPQSPIGFSKDVPPWLKSERPWLEFVSSPPSTMAPSIQRNPALYVVFFHTLYVLELFSEFRRLNRGQPPLSLPPHRPPATSSLPGSPPQDAAAVGRLSRLRG